MVGVFCTLCRDDFSLWNSWKVLHALQIGPRQDLFSFIWLWLCKSNLLVVFPFFKAEWVALNYVPFAERSLEVVVDLYQKTACHKAVVNEKVLQNIIKVNKTYF